MPRIKDVGWEHGKMIGGCRHHLQCNYCQKMITGGGITRLKEHLACLKGEVKGCQAVPEEVRDALQKNLSEEKEKRGKRKKTLLVVPSQEMEIADTRLESSDGKTYDNTAPNHGKGKKTMENQEFMVSCQAIKLVKNDEGFTPPRATDPGWAHGVMVDGERHKVKCKYCQKVVVGGGIYRLKEHLAGVRGNVAACDLVPEDVHLQFKKLLESFEKRKRHKGLDTCRNISSAPFNDNCNGDYDRGMGKNNKMVRSIRKKKQKNNNSYQQMTIIHSEEPLNQSFLLKEAIEEADAAVARFIYDAGIILPSSASNSLYFQNMASAIAAAGPDYKMPSSDIYSGKLLNKNVQEAKQLCMELRSNCWEMSGCSVLVERWTDKIGRTVINFFVYSCKGVVFIKSLDTIHDTLSSLSLLNLFDSVVEEVGSDNIVNFITDTEPRYKAAGKALEAKYRSFFWTACSAHCIDLMLEKIAEMDEVKEVLGKAKQITRFIYNNSSVISFMGKRSVSRDIIQPGNNKYESIFLTLKSITSLKEPLHQILSNARKENFSFFTEKAGGVEVGEIIEERRFWSLCDQTMKATEPLLTVLSLLDCEDRPSCGYIYDGVDKAKRSIVSAFNNQNSDYLPYVNVVDHVWNEELYSPLHAAGYYLNPSIFYNSRFSVNKVIKKGLLDCIELLEPDLCTQVQITKQICCYEDAVGDFGRPIALHGRESLAPATWWSLYASDYPELQRLAIRILSQTCVTYRSQRNWIMFERIHAKKRNRLEHRRLNDFMFVHHNLQLRERQESRKTRNMIDACSNPLCFETLDPELADWVEEESIDDDNCRVMAPTNLDEDSVLSSQLLGSDTFNVSINDYCR